jgi:hypothetical protein
MSAPASKQFLAALTLVAALLVANVTTTAPHAQASAGSEQDAISRLYIAAFDRPADAEGLAYWHSVLQRGIDITEIADYFVHSPEFKATYGSFDNTRLVTLIYRNVLGRDPDGPGLAYWVGLLDQGHSPGTVLNGFAQSQEFITRHVSSGPAHVLMIGDSIFHGIRLLEIGIGSAHLTFMTEEGRQASTLPDLVDQASEQGLLDATDIVVIHLGTNGWQPDYIDMFDEQLMSLAPKQVLIVNTEVARPWEGAANVALARISQTHDNASLIDWNSAVAPHPEWMSSDGVHPTAGGLRALADLIESGVSKVY